MSDFREEEKLGKIYDSRLARRLFRYLRPYRGLVTLAVILTPAVVFLSAVGPLLWQRAIDRYIVPSLGNNIASSIAIRGVGWIALAYTGALAVGFCLEYLQVRVMQKVGQQTMYDLRKEVFDRLQKLPMSFYDRSPVGRLVTRVTTDIDALNDLFAAGISAMINDAVLLVFFIFIMLRTNWSLALATLASLPFLFLATWLFRNQVRDANRRIRTAIARINAFLQEHISGMSVVQLFNRESKSRAQFAELNRLHMEAYKDAVFSYALFYPGVEFVGIVAIVTVFWYGGLKELTGAIPIGVLIMFMQYAQRFFQPIQDLSEKFNTLQSAMAASERIFTLLDEPLAATAADGGQNLTDVRGEIEFRNVWFAYHGGDNPKDEDWILRDVSFRVEPGQTAAIVGHTGAGKTTTIQLLLRFYEIQRGQILLDGKDIREINVQDLRRQFGIVLQDPFLFTGTLESNVRLGTETVDRAAVEQALQEVGLGPFLSSLPQGLDTVVSERGATFSVGQRQLVSFARALAHDPHLLILDEATSSVDTRTEMMIREALDRLLTGRTAIVIAHRLSTIQHADRIIVFHKGRLREQGTHQELLVQRGIYHRLYQLQYKDQELRVTLPPHAPAAGETLPAQS